jgi:hypothetical protein
MTSKFKELEDRIKAESQTVDHLQSSLQQAKIELETDQTMLMSNKQFLEKEKKDLEQLDKSIGVRAQLADKVSLKKKKQGKLREAAERLVKHETEVRKHIQDEIIDRVTKEQEEARKLGQLEAKDDPELKRLAKLEAMKKAEEDEIAFESSEINNLTKHLKKKPTTKKSSHKKVSEVYEDVYGDDHIEQLDKRASKAKKFAAQSAELKKHKMQEEPEMPLDMHVDHGEVAVLDAEAPMEEAPIHKKKSHVQQAEKKGKVMSADDTDTDKPKETSTKKGLSLSHKGYQVKEKSASDKKMQKKDKATEQMKKEFKKQMDLTKNIGEEPEPKAPKAEKKVKAEAKKEKKVEPKELPKKEEAPAPAQVKETPKMVQHNEPSKETHNDEAPKEEAPKEEAPKETAHKEEAPKEETPKEESHKKKASKKKHEKKETPKEAPKEDKKSVAQQKPEAIDEGTTEKQWDVKKENGNQAKAEELAEEQMKKVMNLMDSSKDETKKTAVKEAHDPSEKPNAVERGVEEKITTSAGSTKVDNSKQ